MVIFLFFTIYTEQIVWQMYMCTIELGIQTNIFLKVSNMFWFSTCFSRNYQGILDLKLIFYQGGVHEKKYFYLWSFAACCSIQYSFLACTNFVQQCFST